MHPKLLAVIETMDLYQATYPEDACVIVADTEKVLAYKPGSMLT